MNLDDADDAQFIEKYGGLPNLSLASRLIKQHGLLDWKDDDPVPEQSRERSAQPTQKEKGTVSELQNKLLLLAHSKGEDHRRASHHERQVQDSAKQ